MLEFCKGRILLQFETDREEDSVGKVQGRVGSFVSLINFGLCNIISLAAKLKKKALQRECPLSFLDCSRVIYEIRRELNLISTSPFLY